MKTNRLSAGHPGLCATVLLMALCAASVGAAADDPLSADLPTTRLFDTGAPLTGRLPARPEAGQWRLVSASTMPGPFAGDAVVLNDHIVLVVHRGADGVQLYSRGAMGMELRAVLSAAVAGGSGAVRDVQTTENSASAVALAVTFERGAPMTVRITTGDVKVEVRGAAGLSVRSGARWAVVPDFFANDMVFGADDLTGGRLGLPAENFFLSLLDGNDCMLMTVWDAPGSEPELVASQTSAGRAAFDWLVTGSSEGRVWVAVLEGPGIWQEGAAPGATAGLALDWVPPFPAKWRADVLGSGPLALSLALQGPGDDEEGATATCACTVAAGRTVLDLPASVGNRVVIYPLDRGLATPLTAICPIDVVRTALGVGPCQYILATEGMDADALPTPADVTHRVERLFARGREGRQADTIRDGLNRMVAHVAHAEERISRYREFAHEVRRTCADHVTGSAAHAAEVLQATADDMERALGGGEADVSAEARRLADGIAALIGQPGAAEECAKLGAQLRAIGAVQDRALASGRMGVRWLRQQCRTVAAADPAGAGLATQLQARAEAMLKQQLED